MVMKPDSSMVLIPKPTIRHDPEPVPSPSHTCSQITQELL